MTTDAPEPAWTDDEVAAIFAGITALPESSTAPAPVPEPAPVVAEPQPETASGGLSTGRRWAVAGILIVATAVVGAAFGLSFNGITDVATLAGISSGITWLMPVCVDGAVVVGTVAWLWKYIQGAGWRELGYPALVVLAGTGISVWLNALHAQAHANPGTPPKLEEGEAMVVSALPALMLAVCVHLVADLVADLVPRPERKRSPEPLPQVATAAAAHPVSLAVSLPVSPEPLISEPAVSPSMSPARLEIEPKPEPRRERPVSPKVSAQGSSNSDAHKWIKAQLRNGKGLTGEVVAEQFDVSLATGKRWLKAAREELASK